MVVPSVRRLTAFRPDTGEQKIHDERKTRIHEYGQQAETRGKYAAQRRRALRSDCTVSGAVKASGRPCSTIHEPRKARVNDLWSRTLQWAAQSCTHKTRPEGETPGRRRRKPSRTSLLSTHETPSGCVCVPLQTVASECSANYVSSLRRD